MVAILFCVMPAYLKTNLSSDFWLLKAILHVPLLQPAAINVGSVEHLVGLKIIRSLHWYGGCVGGLGLLFVVIGAGYLVYSFGVGLGNFVFRQDWEVLDFIEGGDAAWYFGLLQGLLMVVIGGLAAIAWIVTLPMAAIWGGAALLRLAVDAAYEGPLSILNNPPPPAPPAPRGSSGESLVTMGTEERSALCVEIAENLCRISKRENALPEIAAPLLQLSDKSLFQLRMLFVGSPPEVQTTKADWISAVLASKKQPRRYRGLELSQEDA